MENLVELKKKFKGKRVFLTGHTGFKGSWFLILLKLIGAEVKGYSLKPEKISLFNKIKGQFLCESIIGDLIDKELIAVELIKFKPDFVFHFAAQALVNESYSDPSKTFNSNIVGTINLLESIRLLKKKCTIIIITTDKVYKNKEKTSPYYENDELGGYDPYSCSKSCVELIIKSYRNSFFNLKNIDKHQKAIAVARAGNVIGGGDYSKGRIVNDIINSIVSEKAIALRYPDSIRPWQHVLEPLNGYLILAIKLYENPKIYSTAFNFGPKINDCISVLNFTKKMLGSWVSNINIEIDKKNINHETGILMLSIKKANKMLDWTPKTNIDNAINQTVFWYKNKKNSDLKKCELQIKQFYN